MHLVGERDARAAWRTRARTRMVASQSPGVLGKCAGATSSLRASSRAIWICVDDDQVVEHARARWSPIRDPAHRVRHVPVEAGEEAEPVLAGQRAAPAGARDRVHAARLAARRSAAARTRRRRTRAHGELVRGAHTGDAAAEDDHPAPHSPRIACAARHRAQLVERRLPSRRSRVRSPSSASLPRIPSHGFADS